MYIPKPFQPIKITSEGLEHIVNVTGKTITFGANSLPKSIIANGYEVLASPIRLVGKEDDEVLVWEDNYPDNESESFVQKRAEDQVIICGAMCSTCFIADTAITIDYDGCMSIDLKMTTRGKSVAACFGLEKVKERRNELQQLWLEIPLRKEVVDNYTMFPNAPILIGEKKTERGFTAFAGHFPDEDMALPFRNLLWLGGDNAGLGFFAENEKNWQPLDDERAIEIIHREKDILVRIHLLDSHPKTWLPEDYAYRPIVFRFGFQATPVKPFPAQPYLHNALHLDCFIKVKGNYRDFLLAEKNGKNRFDRMKEKGVNTLVLHEKWNKIQNYFELSEYTGEQLKLIVEECHKRGIKVLTYFGYEFSTLSPEWTEKADEILVKNGEEQKFSGGWYRFPYQRAFRVCYNNDWKDRFVDGVIKIMDTYHTDGVYLDGTAYSYLCTNTKHGCGWYDIDGKLHGSRPWGAIRKLFRRLYEQVEMRGGMINVHQSGCIGFFTQSFIHMNWYGEDLQMDYVLGKLDDFPLDHFQVAYTGRNMGVPVEMLAYANPPVWEFKSAISMAIIHGILPRPNDIETPLDLMSEIWKVYNRFPFDKSQWHPYWTNGVKTSNEAVKVSYYKYMALDGKPMMLVLCANATKNPVQGVEITFEEDIAYMQDALTGEEVQTLDFCKYGYKILFARG